MYLIALNMSEDELKAALKSKLADERFVAAYAVGERRLRWPLLIIPILNDSSDSVRQASRRSLIILNFLELNPEEAARLARPVAGSTPTPLANLTKPVDFGPASGASQPRREEAIAKWTEWWDERDRLARPVGAKIISSSAVGEESERLAKALLAASAKARADMLAKYRDTKGVKYTEAMAVAIARSPYAEREELRDVLADRLIRMTDATLREYLDDSLPEIRRAAALGLAKRKSTDHADRLADMLLDSEPLVARAAHTALCQLSGKDLGPSVTANEAEKEEAALAWKKWVRQKKPSSK